ncbi:hypothetical protein PAECIP111892_00847 [Paenibacillus auburnensis]|uniref:Uncharacterized protein n=1 Tax=Paenibacillus auburnensis TaxID=2905649 RepID=A0ABN8FTE6_9BACL|nr:hypothetical protein PAECIP111892_00847 [Paenibacillus auburnensis]
MHVYRIKTYDMPTTKKRSRPSCWQTSSYFLICSQGLKTFNYYSNNMFLLGSGFSFFFPYHVNILDNKIKESAPEELTSFEGDWDSRFP